MSVKCVFQCTGKKPQGDHEGAPIGVTLEARYGDPGGNKFINDFSRYTPCGRMEMTVDNPPAAEQFEVGGYYVITLERHALPADAPAPA